jgi:uncharacterized repeat protein (TIGR03837 family)
MEYRGIDIFCTIIDNFGDAGVVYRLAKELKKSEPKKEIRILFNRYNEIAAINPKLNILKKNQEIDGIVYILREKKTIEEITPNEVIIEAFGCDIEEEYLNKTEKKTLIFNLEYLSAEKWVEDYHKMNSFTEKQNIKKYFFMPGFTEKTGGLIISRTNKELSRDILKEFYNGNFESLKIGTIFSYEHNFKKLISDILNLNERYLLLVMGEKSKESFRVSMGNLFSEEYKGYYKKENIEIIFMPFVTQEKYDEIISVADFNFVRGEESLARAALSGKPFIWHAYLQKEMVHMDKVEAFLEILSYYTKDKKKFEKYRKLVYNYNCRKKNDFQELKDESYVDFFKNFEEIKSWSNNFSIYLNEKCNLVQKLLNFINHEKF